MSEYHILLEEIKHCKNESQLLKIATHIDTNKKELGLDDYQVDRLEQVGIQTLERIQIDGAMMMKNGKRRK